MQEPCKIFEDGLPDELLALEPLDLVRSLGRPTLVRIPGSGGQAPRCVATLLHGDEQTGLEAIITILRRKRHYPFDLYVVFGNVEAAAADEGFCHRYLDGQEDFNRVWGIGSPTTRQRMAADAILERLRGAQLESLVDVHNNSGDNPFFAIVTRDDVATMHLATRFTTTLLWWDLQVNTLMEALGNEVAAIAIECGLPEQPESTAFAVDGLRRYLGALPLPDDEVRCDYDLLGDLRRVSVRPEVRFRFGGGLDRDHDFVVADDADVHNFVEVVAGHVLGDVVPGAALPVTVTAPDGRDVTDDYFAVHNGSVVTTRTTTPVMMTRTVEAARKDCLYYLATSLWTPGTGLSPRVAV